MALIIIPGLEWATGNLYKTPTELKRQLSSFRLWMEFWKQVFKDYNHTIARTGV